MTPTTTQLRTRTIDRLRETVMDVLVIGGGIVGSGVARDAAMRGLNVGLVDRHDFAYGTSSRSSRLLHGGLRYLEQGRIGLVREASLEKRIVSTIAPHLAHPLAFIFPTYRPNGRPLWQLKIGVKLYELLCSGKNFGASHGLSSAQTLKAIAPLNPAGLRGSVRYYDALTNDARLVVDTLRSAAHAGAQLANYVRFLDGRRENGAWTCAMRDELTGATLQIRALTLVNATGPWAQDVPHSSVKLRLSKGIHVVVDQKRLPVTDAIVVTEGKRILFVLPWGERVIIGTTDTDYEAAPEDVSVNADDVGYVLRVVNEAFPRVKLTTGDIVSTWAGLRPLIANPDGSPSDISRAHQIRTPKPGWWDVAGGKLTTYRLMAEQTVDQIVRHLERTVPACRTADEVLLPAHETKFSGICPAACTREAVRHYVEYEWAVSLTDVLVRRSGWHYYHSPGNDTADQVAGWMAELLSWTPSERERQLSEYHRLTAAAG